MPLFAQNTDIPYQLEVLINDHPTKLIGSFVKLPTGRFAARRTDLIDMRLTPPGTGADTELVPLDNIPGLTYDYDEAQQKIAIRVKADALQHQSLNVYDSEKPRPQATTTTGAVINYGLFSVFDQGSFAQYEMLDGVTLTLDGRLFGEWGTFDNSGIIGSVDFDTVRLQSTWSYSIENSLVTLNAGDLVSGGLSWTRPIRMGGFQVRRNFGIRPDLITKPLPQISGSAAVPSTVDVYVNNVKTHSQQIPGGPFTVNNIPVISGNGMARVVVRDASGRETVTEAPFYSSPDLLRKGIFDYSLESGAARLNYGLESNDYDDSVIALGSMRYGFSDDLTLSAHAEAGAGLLNASFGITGKLGTLGVATLAASASSYDGDAGAQLFASFETRLNRLYFHARGQHTFGEYRDLAALTFDPTEIDYLPFTLAGLMPPKTLAFASFGFPVDLTGGNVNMSYLHRTNYDGDQFNIANMSYSQRLRQNVTMHASAFKDLSDSDGLGAFVGLTLSMGNRSSVSAGVDHDSKGTSATMVYTKNADITPGSFGWQIRDTEGRNTMRQAAVDYNGAKVRLRGQISQNDEAFAGSIYADGAVAMTRDGVFTSKRIEDSFAVVDAGAPDIEVSHENRVIGRTGEDGKLLVPGLRAWEENKITINPDDLPATVQVPETRVKAVPRYRSAVNVKFDTKSTMAAALVTVRDAEGRYIAAGFTGRHLGSGSEFVVGYDGQIYLESLSASNEIEIELSDRKCRASFAFKPETNSQAAIDGVVCR